MEVSVIIPTRNREWIVSKCIEHILNQDYPQYEVIVIDDGSQDNTKEGLKRYSNNRNFKFISLPERRVQPSVEISG